MARIYTRLLTNMGIFRLTLYFLYWENKPSLALAADGPAVGLSVVEKYMGWLASSFFRLMGDLQICVAIKGLNKCSGQVV